MRDYDRLDEIYREYPEIKELVVAANHVVMAALQTYPLTEDTMRDSLGELKKAGQALDNRNWLKSV